VSGYYLHAYIYIYVAGNSGNQAFPEMHRQAIPEMPGIPAIA